mgnify:CR=1 FL=1
MIPDTLTMFQRHYTPENIKALSTRPLDAVGLAQYTEFRNLQQRNLEKVSGDTPLHVMEHPSSKSHVARTSVYRLERDIHEFSEDENVSMAPVFKSIFDDGDTNLDLIAATNVIETLEKSLVQTRNSDSEFVRSGIPEILAYCNGSSHAHAGSLRAMGHRLHQFTGAGMCRCRCRYNYKSKSEMKM